MIGFFLFQLGDLLGWGGVFFNFFISFTERETLILIFTQPKRKKEREKKG